jgi:hypothetical protein
MANAAIGLLWILSLVMILIRRQATSPSGLRRKKIQRLKAALASLESSPENEFTPLAVACLLTALDTDSRPLEAAVLLAKLSVDAEIKAALINLLSLDEESKYSTGGGKVPDQETRKNILSALKKIPV